jgi:hypothetical protein
MVLVTIAVQIMNTCGIMLTSKDRHLFSHGRFTFFYNLLTNVQSFWNYVLSLNHFHDLLLGGWKPGSYLATQIFASSGSISLCIWKFNVYNIQAMVQVMHFPIVLNPMLLSSLELILSCSAPRIDCLAICVQRSGTTVAFNRCGVLEVQGRPSRGQSWGCGTFILDGQPTIWNFNLTPGVPRWSFTSVE